MSDARVTLPPPGSDCSLTITGEKKKAVGEYITKLGPELRKRHGKQTHYTPSQVRQAAVDGAMRFDYLCFAYCMYCSPSDFALVHAAAGEACDYAAMHAAIGATFFHGATEFEGGGLADLVWSITGGVTDGVVGAASLVGDAAGTAWSVAGTVGEAAGGVVGGVFELLGGAADAAGGL
jgi:hypothetical protein